MNSVRDAGEPLKGRIGLEEKIVPYTAVAVELDLDDAKPLVERVKDGPVAELAGARRGGYR